MLLARARWYALRSELLLQLFEDGRILQCRHVLRNVLAFGDRSQQAAHDLARTRLRQIVTETDFLGLCDRADLLAHPVAQLLGNLLCLVTGWTGLLENHEGAHRFTRQFVGAAYHGGLRDLRIR